ncbi:hypothetical protein ACFL3I_08875 [Pseudomonadota bacterium]
MKILRVGDTQKAACSECKSFVTVTFKLRTVPFSDGIGAVKNVLVGVCDRCDCVAVLPHQSTPVVKKQMDAQRKGLESRVPAHMVDILNLASVELSGGTEFVPGLIKFYIHSLSNNDISARDIPAYLESELAKGKSQKRISIKGRLVTEEVDRLKKITNIRSTTDLLKAVVLKINDDVLVKKKTRTIKQLKNIVSATV